MADEKPSIHIDSDWKKQAQEEKKRLAEQEAQRQTAAAPAAPAVAAPAGAPSAAAAPGRAPGAAPAGARAGRAGREGGELPAATFATLVQSLVTQTLFYLGDLSVRGGQPQVNLDMAKHNVDLLNLLEEKTKGNLTDDEKRLLDAALYETRMRYVSVASQYIGP